MAVKGKEYWKQQLEKRKRYLVASETYMARREQELLEERVPPNQVADMLEAELADVEGRLLRRVIQTVDQLSSRSVEVDSGRRILEVGVGPGNLAELLCKFSKERGYVYSGVDFLDDMLEETRGRLLQAGMSEADFDLRTGGATELPHGEGAMWLVTWGRLGIHLTDDDYWRTALIEVQRVAEPGGYFLLYEPLTDNNSKYAAQPVKNARTRIRSLAEYSHSLPQMIEVASDELHYLDEAYTIAVWQRLSKQE